ncbi:hypothetical protein [Streptomyces liangshanensis]|uniref:Uncharacterized protein n=1 Tax=Streptomyces liangshanensis TaxID=2717324 RepID=A0A6G9H4H4_9ACTN|nr:hypothetical protein [Streptomyces liangshanensis]QIQ05438.1 hypothetical protein HA039_26905 [Streptomyces liangshanensis]
MPARTYPRTRPGTAGALTVRLPWWALVLPAAAFAVLLVLMAGPGQAQAASTDPGIARILDLTRQVLVR